MKGKMTAFILGGIGIAFLVSAVVVYLSDKKNDSDETVITLNRPNTERISVEIPVREENQEQKQEQAKQQEEQTESEPVSHEPEPEPEKPAKEQNKEKGDNFEKYIVKNTVDGDFCRLEEWTGDKYVEGIYAESNKDPDLKLSCQFGAKRYEFYVECKYKSKTTGTVTIREDQFKRYKQFSRDKRRMVVMAIGIGGSSTAPDCVYLIPLSDLKDHAIKIDNFAANCVPYGSSIKSKMLEVVKGKLFKNKQ